MLDDDGGDEWLPRVVVVVMEILEQLKAVEFGRKVCGQSQQLSVVWLQKDKPSRTVGAVHGPVKAGDVTSYGDSLGTATGG